jgi:23S rRNA (adenine2503-C2)-methyltransferase
MTTIAKSLRNRLTEQYQIYRPQTVQVQTSLDGTWKRLLRFSDGNETETVYIPEKTRGSLCISSQIGCTLTCKFCNTGTQPLVRNLTVSEIIGQLMIARDFHRDWQTSNNRMISNIVLMGTGEPLFNYNNVAKAIKIIMNGDGISISKRRITLSTSGVVPIIRRCSEELHINLAISLNAANDEIRNQLMPINKKYPLNELIQSIRDYQTSNARRVTFEYIMLKGINDTMSDARALIKLVRGIPAKFNLIPFNKWAGCDYECSDMKNIKRFSDTLLDAGYYAPIRYSRGGDIFAACGQLKSNRAHDSNLRL